MWTQTRVSAMLKLQYPIFQGPFGGGNSTPSLAAAVSNAGALGAYGAVGLEPDELTAIVAAIRERTEKPFAVNLWVPIESHEGVHEAVHEEVAGYERQIEALLRTNIAAYSFVMGCPDAAVIREIRRQNAVAIGTATTADEAIALQDAGVDLIVASGSDAGGHRGSFLRRVEDSLVGTFSLVPQIIREVDVPVVAAGGITNGNTIAAALALGAEGVQIGTAFLATHESGAPTAHKQLLGTERSRWTRLTRAFSGRFARGMVNDWMNELEREPEKILPYPAQYDATRPTRRAAGEQGDAEHIALWAGQTAPLARAMAASDLVALLARETDTVLTAKHLRPRTAQ